MNSCSQQNWRMCACLDGLQAYDGIACKIDNAQLAAGAQALWQLCESVVIQAELLQSRAALHVRKGCSIPHGQQEATCGHVKFLHGGIALLISNGTCSECLSQDLAWPTGFATGTRGQELTWRLSPRSDSWLCAMESLLRAVQWCRALPRSVKALFFSTRVFKPLISFKPAGP